MKHQLKFQLGRMHGEARSWSGAIVLFVMFVVYRLTQVSLLAATATFVFQLLRSSN